MYEELVKRLRNRANGSYEEKCEGCEFTEDFPPCVHCTIKAFNDAADAIEELSKFRWIPVTERLPEKSGWYLANVFSLCVRWGEITTNDSEWIQLVFYNEGKFHKMTGSNVKVTHWMPLPEPPKEDAPTIIPAEECEA